jgi:FkbM family methyltransferase
MMTKPPLQIRVLPDRLKQLAYYLSYKPLPARLKPLLKNATLRFASGVTMTALVEGDIISESIALTGFYELKLSRRIAKAAAQGGRFVDVGANLGYFSLIWLAARPDNKCISIEASPRNLPLLKQNIESNGFQDRCRIEGVAAGKERGTLGFELGPLSQSGWGCFVFDKTSSTVDVEVEVVRLDEIIRDDEAISVLKIDAEGADTWVLQGCERLLSKGQVRTIYYELFKDRSERLGIQDDDARRLLERYGFRVQSLTDPDARTVEYLAVKI